MTPKKEEIRETIIKRAIKNLAEFGYPSVTAENIFTDEVYKLFFESMLKENITGSGSIVDNVLEELLREVQ